MMKEKHPFWYYTSLVVATSWFFYMYFTVWIPSWPFVQKKLRVHYTNAVHVEDDK